MPKTVTLDFDYTNFGFKIQSKAVNGILEQVTIFDIRNERVDNCYVLKLKSRPKLEREQVSHSVLPVLQILKDVLDIAIQEIKDAEVV